MAAKEARLEALELKVEQQQEMIAALQKKKNNERQANSIDSKSIPSVVDGNNRNPDKLVHPVAATMPKSCADLSFMRHTLNGFYLIMGSTQIETVFCDFSTIPSDPSMPQTFLHSIAANLLYKYLYYIQIIN